MGSNYASTEPTFFPWLFVFTCTYILYIQYSPFDFLIFFYSLDFHGLGLRVYLECEHGRTLWICLIVDVLTDYLDV